MLSIASDGVNLYWCTAIDMSQPANQRGKLMMIGVCVTAFIISPFPHAPPRSIEKGKREGECLVFTFHPTSPPLPPYLHRIVVTSAISLGWEPWYCSLLKRTYWWHSGRQRYAAKVWLIARIILVDQWNIGMDQITTPKSVNSQTGILSRDKNMPLNRLCSLGDHGLYHFAGTICVAPMQNMRWVGHIFQNHIHYTANSIY